MYFHFIPYLKKEEGASYGLLVPRSYIPLVFPAFIECVLRLASLKTISNILSGNLNGSCRCLSVAFKKFVQSVPWSWSVGVGVPVALPLPLSFLYATQGFHPPSLPFLCLSTSSEVWHLPLLAIPLTPAKLAIGLRDGSLIVACRNDCTGTSASGVALDVPCVTIWDHGTACVLVYWNGAGTFSVTLSEEHKNQLMPSLAANSNESPLAFILYDSPPQSHRLLYFCWHLQCFPSFLSLRGFGCLSVQYSISKSISYSISVSVKALLHSNIRNCGVSDADLIVEALGRQFSC